MIMSEEKRFTLRMDNDLFELVKAQAEKNKRSIAKEIEYAVEQFLFQEKTKNSNADQR